MTNTMTYKGYSARIDYDDEDGIFTGRIAGIRDCVGLHADNVNALREAFHEAVEDYLETCARVGKKPQKPYSGRMMFRVSPEVHRKAALAAELSGKSLNQWAEEVLERAVSGNGKTNARRSCSDKTFLLKFFVSRGDLTRTNPSNGLESMLTERRVALTSAAQAFASSKDDPNNELVHQPAQEVLALACRRSSAMYSAGWWTRSSPERRDARLHRRRSWRRDDWNGGDGASNGISSSASRRTPAIDAHGLQSDQNPIKTFSFV